MILGGLLYLFFFFKSQSVYKSISLSIFAHAAMLGRK